MHVFYNVHLLAIFIFRIYILIYIFVKNKIDLNSYHIYIFFIQFYCISRLSWTTTCCLLGYCFLPKFDNEIG